MKSTELPDGWIVEPSKSLPNRVYYFNTRTNKSSWEFPVEETQNAGPSKPANKGRKRKSEYPASDQRPVTPDPEIPKKTKAEQRRTLKAKRTIVTATEQNVETAQNADTTKTKDTPQMQLLREKMLQRQAKGNASRRSKVTRVDPPENEVAPVNEEKPTTSTDLELEAQNLTPQMRVLLEKMKERQSKVANSKTTTRRSITSQAKPATLRRPKTRSVGSPETIANELDASPRRSSRTVGTNNAVAGKTVKTSQRPSVMLRREIDAEMTKYESDLSPEKPKTPRLGRTARKNLAQERLEKLQRSLNEEQTELDDCSSSSYEPDNSKCGEILRHDDSLEIMKITGSPPSIYKNADLRAKFLRERLQNKLLYEKKMNPVVISGESRNRAIEEESTPEIPNDSFYEEMEWETIEDEKLMQEVQAVRTHIGGIDDTSISQEIPQNSLDLPDGPSTEKTKPSLYIVIDTNVFLSNISAIEEARDAIFKTYGRPLIVVPWTVIRELDFIKDDKSMSRPACLKAKARQAVRFLHQHFSARHPRVLGQTSFDVSNNKERFEFECPDDEILQTCLQIRTSANNVVLLSYDKNLCNKAMIHDVVTLGRYDPLEKVDYLHASDVKNDSFLAQHLRGEEQDPDVVPVYVKELRKSEELMEKAKEIVTSFLTVIVAREMQNLYSENWEKYTFIKPPWSVHGVLRCAVRHWIAAVSGSFTRKAEPLLKELLDAFDKAPDSGRKLSDVSHILEIINDILQCVKVEKYPNVISVSSRAIADLRANCAETCKQLYEEKIRDSWGAEDDARVEEARADRAFQQFEEVYAFARDMCGLASSAIGMPCSFPFKKLNPEPTLNDVKEMQPDVAANLNRLLQVLGTALEEIQGLHVDHRAVEALYHALSTFMPERKGQSPRDFTPLDVYWCLKRKDKVLRLGLVQLQELSSHFCRMASFRCT